MGTLSDFEKITKQSKRKSLFRNIVWSVTLSVVIIVIMMRGLVELTSRNGQKILEYYDYLNTVAYPNIYYQNYYFKATGLFSGEFTSDRIKNIDGIEVPFVSMSEPYSLMTTNVRDSNSQGNIDQGKSGFYSQSQQLKIPVFFNVNDAETQYNPLEATQELEVVDKMVNQAVEVAITFDKPYTYDEIQDMIPDNVLINWYWIGTTYNTFNMQDTLGIMSFDEGKLTPEQFQQFREKLQKGINHSYLNTSYHTTDQNGNEIIFNLEDDAKAYLEDNESLNNATFSGVIISGRAENLAQLQDKTWIFASNIGQSVDIMPYHKLIKN